MRHSASTGHRTKKQFQPSITSFFAREDRDDYFDDDGDERGPGASTNGGGPITRSLAHHHQHHARDGRPPRQSVIPTVPGSVQADLLSVGMRVRKSVPEGYKTHKTASLPSIQTTLSKSPSSSISTSTAQHVSDKPPRDPVPEVYQHQRELLPFCGLHKIGGYAEQPVTNTHLYGGHDSNGDRPVNLFPLPAEAFSTPFSSHDSAASSISTDSLPPNPLNPHKRSWQDDDAHPHLSSNFLFAIPKTMSEDEVPVSPLSATPVQSINALPQGAALRPFAQPKTRRPGARVGVEVERELNLFKDADMEVDDENVQQAEGRVVVGSSSDFGEADFLRPWSPGREVDMGGV